MSSLKALINNGYVSNTLKTVQIGLISEHEWIGEDPLIAEEPSKYLFEYSAVARTKLVTFEISFSDLSKVPQRARDQMCAIAAIRKKMMA